jgi:hypothetical protein
MDRVSPWNLDDLMLVVPTCVESGAAEGRICIRLRRGVSFSFTHKGREERAWISIVVAVEIRALNARLGRFHAIDCTVRGASMRV